MEALECCMARHGMVGKLLKGPTLIAQGGDPERLAWFAESERIHSRWAMLAVAGILVQVTDRAALPLVYAFLQLACMHVNPCTGLQQRMPPIAQEIVRPDVFWYDAALKSPMPFGSSPAAILGLVRARLPVYGVPLEA
jgi:hypothetical protein